MQYELMGPPAVQLLVPSPQAPQPARRAPRGRTAIRAVRVMTPVLHAGWLRLLLSGCDGAAAQLVVRQICFGRACWLNPVPEYHCPSSTLATT